MHDRRAFCFNLSAGVGLLGCVALIGALGCATPTSPDAERVPVLPPQARTDEIHVTHYPAQAWFDRSLGLGSYDADTLDAIASGDLAVFQMKILWSPEGARAVRELRRRNSDLVVIGILNVLSFKEEWASPSQQERYPLVQPLWRLLSPYPAYTTQGDSAMMWAGAPMLNPWTPHGYREDLLLDYVDLVCSMALRYPDIADGVFLDYLSERPFLYPGQNDAVTGWVDLDGDGIDSRDDVEEQEVWQQWQRRLASELQSRFGEGWIQIGNGHMPHVDRQLAQNLAGIAYEAYPTTVWNKTDLEGFELSLEHLASDWLHPRRGRDWSLLWDNRNRNPEFARVASLITQQFYCLSDFSTVTLDRDRVPYAATTNPWHAVDNPDGSRVYTRVYDAGTPYLTFDAAGRNIAAGIAAD